MKQVAVRADEDHPRSAPGQRAQQLGLVEPHLAGPHRPGLGVDRQTLATGDVLQPGAGELHRVAVLRSEEHTSELQSLMRISYAVFCLKKNIRKRKVDKHKTSLNSSSLH